MSSYQYPPLDGAGDFGAPAPIGNNQKAVWSLILGITSLFCTGVILGPIAIVLGVLARKEIQRSAGQQTGTGMATAGIVLGVIAVAMAIVVLVVVVPLLLDSSLQ